MFPVYKRLITQLYAADRHKAFDLAEQAVAITKDPRAALLLQRLNSNESYHDIDFSDLTGKTAQAVTGEKKPSGSTSVPTIGKTDFTGMPAPRITLSVKKGGLFSKNKYKVRISVDDGQLPGNIRLFMGNRMPINRNATPESTIRPAELKNNVFEYEYKMELTKTDKKVFFRIWMENSEFDDKVIFIKDTEIIKL